MNTFINAAEKGILENMKWLKNNNCPWNHYTFIKAVEHGNLENIDWLINNGCPWDNYLLMDSKE